MCAMHVYMTGEVTRVPIRLPPVSLRATIATRSARVATTGCCSNATPRYHPIGVRMPRRGPGTKARNLAAELRKLREARGLRLSEVADDLGWDKSKLSRTENGLRKFTLEETVQLLGYYKVKGDQYARLVAAARSMNEPGWWEFDLQGLSEDSRTLVAYESSADEIISWSPFLIPGLLQTPDYTGELLRAHGGLTFEQRQERVAGRLRRQQVLNRKDVRFVGFIAELSLRTPGIERPVMRRQLAHLLEMQRRPNVSVRVVPWDATPHRALLTPFIFLRSTSDVVHVELISSGVFLDDEDDTRVYEKIITELDATSLSEAESVRVIEAQEGERT